MIAATCQIAYGGPGIAHWLDYPIPTLSRLYADSVGWQAAAQKRLLESLVAANGRELSPTDWQRWHGAIERSTMLLHQTDAAPELPDWDRAESLAGLYGLT